MIEAPIKGEVISLAEVKDQTFASGLLGDGFAIVPSEGKVYAPFDGVCENIFDTLDKTKQKTFPNILKRTQKIFYVCCTRAKKNLAVFYNNPSAEVINKAKEWFGETNIVELEL